MDKTNGNPGVGSLGLQEPNTWKEGQEVDIKKYKYYDEIVATRDKREEPNTVKEGQEVDLKKYRYYDEIVATRDKREEEARYEEDFVVADPPLSEQQLCEIQEMYIRYPHLSKETKQEKYNSQVDKQQDQGKENPCLKKENNKSKDPLRKPAKTASNFKAKTRRNRQNKNNTKSKNQGNDQCNTKLTAEQIIRQCLKRNPTKVKEIKEIVTEILAEELVRRILPDLHLPWFIKELKEYFSS